MSRWMEETENAIMQEKWRSAKRLSGLLGETVSGALINGTLSRKIYCS